MPVKPNVSSQLNRQTGLGRPGGMMSNAIAPKVAQSTKGAGFSAMENSLLKGPTPSPKPMAAGGSGRQFFTQTAGGDLTSGLPKSPKISVKAKKFPTPKIKA